MAAWILCQGRCGVFVRTSLPRLGGTWCPTCTVRQQVLLAEALCDTIRQALVVLEDGCEAWTPEEVQERLEHWWPDLFTPAFLEKLSTFIADEWMEDQREDHEEPC